MNSIGRIFRLSVFGESHGPLIGVTIDGIPHGIPLSKEDLIQDLSRRKPLKKGTTARLEDDEPEFLSGWLNGFSTGAPLTIGFKNSNVISTDYDELRSTPRPGHADYSAFKRFEGFNDYRGGGHFSGRLTLALVAAGVVAKKIIPTVSVIANLISVGGNENIEDAVQRAIERGDSIGGIVECQAKGIPVGVGEPFFDSLESVISHLIFAIPGIRGIEFGAGFHAASMFGSQHNDAIVDEYGRTATNNSGGITGGLANGNDLVFRVAVKPTSSIGLPQQTFNLKTNKIEELNVKGRHDTCIALRVPVVIEAITAIALVDMIMVRHATTKKGLS